MSANETHHDHNHDEHEKKPESIVIHIDHKPYKAPKERMTGSELRALADPDIGPDYDLYRVVPGREDDDLIGDTEEVELKNGMHFYSAPKTINPGELQ